MAKEEDNQQTPEPVNVDALPEDADWTQPTLDLDIASVGALRAFLVSTGTTVEEFKTWPLYRWHVAKPGMAWLKDL